MLYNSVIRNFINANIGGMFPASNWFYLEGINVYLRVGKTRINDCYDTAITVSNISSTAENQGRGYFKQFITYLEQVSAETSESKGIVFENVFNPMLAEMLKKHGYISIGEVFPNVHVFYKEIPHVVHQ